jgi:hypothetical protein
MANADFYRVNFEKEICLQGRSTIFLSIEAEGEYTQNDTLWITPYVQPQTFESKFEGWTEAATPPPSFSSVNTVLFFKKSNFAKNGTDFSNASWNSVKEGDDVKAVTMWRRTLPGETPDSGNGPSDVIKFRSKVLQKGVMYAQSAITSQIEEYYYIELDDQLGNSVPTGNEFMVQVGKWMPDENWTINRATTSEIAKNTLGNASPVFYDAYSPVVPNQFDGMESVDEWPAGAMKPRAPKAAIAALGSRSQWLPPTVRQPSQSRRRAHRARRRVVSKRPRQRGGPSDRACL